jgi:virulence-associated protein VapD
VAKYDKVLSYILRGTSDANIAFEDVRHLLKRLGFAERIRGDHYIFTKEGVEEILNLQPKGSHAKPYQVKQVRAAIVKYRLAGGKNEK